MYIYTCICLCQLREYVVVKGVASFQGAWSINGRGT